MKISIVTFPKAINYGTALQAAALKRKLEDLGNEVRFLEHKCEEIEKTNRVFDFREAVNPKYTLAHLYNLPVALKRKNNFKAFQQKYMSFSNAAPQSFDAVVAGSDQIWNYRLTADDWFYFLDFEKQNTKKIAYAGSFGLSNIPDDKKQKTKECLLDFDFLSVREQTAKALIENEFGIKSDLVVDPTFLIDKNEWKQFFDGDLYSDGYIYVYNVVYSPTVWEFAYKLAEKTGKKIRTVCYSKIHRPNAECCFTAGPSEWLSHISAADYVVTNSFHGVAFSINFNKQFFFELPPQKLGVGSRIVDITTRYGLADRELTKADMDAVIDYTYTNQRLNEDRLASVEFIKSFLK
ncbi:MAG: polysaccharide pyruvyl transferase family protein [Ruminococcaceae bacterium]|nr:polysaccharide pyruvyl transferase family protein [Oscillospiraceae bacterium]